MISHEGCNYDNPGKGLQVDVEKVVGSIFGGDQVILNNPNRSFTTFVIPFISHFNLTDN